MSTWPNTQPAREQMHKAIRLLEESTEDSLREARRICASLVEDIPYVGPAPHCSEYRQRMNATECRNRSCGRCGPRRAQRGG
ncbi:hypothetical protein ACGGAI_23890 [Streptomyces antibioticus]|uniref:hypothetical protein n=1 Tax=Streptomyces antibioticus TaxID=1890 RepID=UPI003711A6AC